MQPKYYGASANYNKGPASPLSKRLIMIAALFFGTLILLAVVFSVISAIGKGPQEDFARVYARVDQVQKLLDKQKASISDGDLASVNASATLLFLGDVSRMGGVMKASYGLDGVPDNILTEIADTTTEGTLKTAVNAGNFDSTFIKTVREKLSAAYNAAQKASDEAPTSNAKDTLKKVMTDLSSIDAQLVDLHLTSGN